MKKIFITGADGFVGKALVAELEKFHIPFIAGSRKLYGDLVAQQYWDKLFLDSDVVVHLAARVHVMEEVEADPLQVFRKINVEATLNLARASKKNGVKRFVFISSVKVHGEETFANPFTADDTPSPLDPYGISKMEAEVEIKKLHEPGVFEVVIIRPPLIYGPGVKANFEKLFWLVRKDLPIPFGRVFNKRSLVSVNNLVDLIIVCMNHPNASGETFLVSDKHDYSLKEIIIEIGRVLNKSPHLLPIPVRFMSLLAAILGKKAYASRLFGNLHVDIEKTCKLLDWYPKYSFQETFTKF